MPIFDFLSPFSRRPRVSTIASAETTFGYAGPEGRRSTRIERPVPLLITGHDGLGQEFLERTSAVSLNLHGCRYPSRHDCHVGTWITLQIGDSGLGELVTTVRAQVRSIQVPRNPRDLYHVGVQLEKPANVWRIPSPPADWQTAAERVSGELPPSKEQTAAATGPGRAPTQKDMPATPEAARSNGEAGESRFLSDELRRLAPAEAFEGAAAPGIAPSETPEAAPAYARPNRVAITPERLLMALQPKMEKAAEAAILAAVSKHLSPALRASIHTIEAARDASVEQVAECFAQQKSAVVHSSREELLARLEDRLDEVRSRWDAQLDGYRVRAEEIVQRIDRQAGAAQKNLGDAREVSERALREVQNRISTMVSAALADALREFDQGVRQAAHLRLTDVLEEVQSLTREATAYMESNVAEARATVQTAATEALGQFRRQAEIHAAVTAQDTTQRLTSALAALDAEHRAACDHRRSSIQEEIQRSGEQVTEQFRQGLRAFFYSCLVAAVGAVEQHSQTTRDGMRFDPGNFLPPDVEKPKI
jgi:hypothetical protein